MTQVRHMSHISHGPPTKDGRTKAQMSKESHLHPQDGKHSPHRSQMRPGKIFRGAVHHFLCAEIQTMPLVDHTRSMHHLQMNTCALLNNSSGLLSIIIQLCLCISLTFSRDIRRWTTPCADMSSGSTKRISSSGSYMRDSSTCRPD
jgi:hypothetical protein